MPLSANAKEHLFWLIGDQTDTTPAHSPVLLMGGEDLDPAKRDWDLYPEKPCILIGTQDMLLSRALNRGYGMSRYRWPIHFGLLNNDCLWVMDETQLMGSGLWTTAQLDWMRHDRFAPRMPVVSWWMSATLGQIFFDMQDRKASNMPKPEVVELLPEEEKSIGRLDAIRPVKNYQHKAATKMKRKTKGSSKTVKADLYFESLSESIVSEHLAEHSTLVVCNRVDHAQRIYRHTTAVARDKAETLLLTSRFRPQDRRATLEKVLAFEKIRKEGNQTKGLILISTQVVEAGVDISSARLWTEEAPWPSFLQRLGRLNRDGKLNDLVHAWTFVVPKEKGAFTGPYHEKDVKLGQTIVAELINCCAENPDASIRQLLRQLAASRTAGPLIKAALEPKPEPFPRALDIHGLFSTEPDVFGGFTDVSPWVRNTDANADATVFWRNFKPRGNEVNRGDGPGFQRDEGCPVAVFRLKEFIGGSRSAWLWNPKSHIWETLSSNALRPGMTILLPASAGGYDPAEGWTGNAKSKPGDVSLPGPFEQADDEDRETQSGEWVTLDIHLKDARRRAMKLAEALKLNETETRALILATELHDIGKSLAAWQEALPMPRPEKTSLWAKAPHSYRLTLPKGHAEAKIVKTANDILMAEKDQQVLHQAVQKKTANLANGKIHHEWVIQTLQRPLQASLKSIECHCGERLKPVRFRPGLRHEVASALAMWFRYYRPGIADFPALAIYLVAAHHGKARTAFASRTAVGAPNVCGIREDNPPQLPWNPEWQMDFNTSRDGADGHFNDDGTFTMLAPGWSGLISDLLGGWEADASKRTCGAVPDDERRPWPLRPRIP